MSRRKKEGKPQRTFIYGGREEERETRRKHMASDGISKNKGARACCERAVGLTQVFGKRRKKNATNKRKRKIYVAGIVAVKKAVD